ncbi:MAG TPA: hypothetical protein VLC55_00260 [Burkholderiales bacterium]|nr:hypothetical protein [Candidatus Methylomirabilis sp.]HSB81475.1 hypothetical protein [Candidatus Methylomirabilis sp.]HSD59272.1 hypothetical protein [Burkholderiales bacterium]
MHRAAIKTSVEAASRTMTLMEMEFGFGDSLPLYAGGLGASAG